MKLKAKGAQKSPYTAEEQRQLILWPFLDFVESQGCDALVDYIIHVGINLQSVTAETDIEALILGHYETGPGEYDIEAAAYDLRRWPPIAECIGNLRKQG